METRAHHVLIGVFTLLVVAVALTFVLWLAKSSTDRDYAFYDVIFNEAVTGLSRGGGVQYNGITVGEVSRLSLDPIDPRKVVARIRVDDGTPVKEDTTAKLAIAGVTGVAFIQLSGGKPQSLRLRAQPDEEVAVIVAQPSAFASLLASGEDIVVSVNDALLRIGQLLSDDNVRRVDSMLGNLDALVGSVASRRDDIGALITELAAASGQLKTTLARIDNVAGSADGLLRNDVAKLVIDLQRAVDSLTETANHASGLIADNRGAVTTFANQSLRQVGPTLVELRQTLEAVERLADELGRSNSLLLGNRKPKEFKPK